VPTVAVDGLQLNYRFDGEAGETIVLVNGLADDLETWDTQVPDIVAAGYRVLRFDNRGIGQSDAPEGPYTTRQMADDTKALVDRLGVQDFHMVGISMGGMIAQEYALAYGADLKSVTLACTYSEPGPFCSRMYSLWADLASREGVGIVMQDVLLWLFTLDFFERREDELREIERALTTLSQPVDAYLAQLASIRTHNTTSRIAGVRTPTLVLAGEADILIPVELSRRLHEQIRGSEWATVPGGHACIWEYPSAFNAAIVDFASRH
jgi:3-oxoadipate enol-lactonase